MVGIPDDILVVIPCDGRPTVERWWSNLSNAERLEAAELWDSRREVYFFTPQPDGDGLLDEWEKLPRVIGGRFVPHDDSVRMDEWLDDWLDYLQGHEEVILFPRVAYAHRRFIIGGSPPPPLCVLTSSYMVE